jgi:hypothetical protein
LVTAEPLLENGTIMPLPSRCGGEEHPGIPKVMPDLPQT